MLVRVTDRPPRTLALARPHGLKSHTLIRRPLPMTQTYAPSLASTPSYDPRSDRDAEPTSRESTRDWTFAERFGFRFLLAYVLLYTFPGPISGLPGADYISKPLDAIWRVVVPWFGAHVLRLASPISLQPSGSGDKLFDWVQVAASLAVAVIAAITWTAIDRRRRSHPRLFAAFALYLSWTLARTMFSYGFDKVLPNQFAPMEPARLTQYIGEASPGGFAWTFLGFSIPYEIFCGVAESIAAVLLLFRRTRTLGALVGSAVLANVFMLNMTFDIPVKQYSGHLLLMCVFLAALDRQRLIDLFLRGRGAAAPRPFELFTTRRSRIAARAIGGVLAVSMIGNTFYGEYRGLYEYGRLAPRGPLYGIFEVEEFVKNGAIQPPLLTDATRWRRFATNKFSAIVRLSTDSMVRFGLRTDTLKRVAILANGPDSTKWARLAYLFPDSAHLALAGRIAGDSVEMKLRRRPESSYPLVSRGFHWVNEVPYFR